MSKSWDDVLDKVALDPVDDEPPVTVLKISKAGASESLPFRGGGSSGLISQQVVSLFQPRVFTPTFPHLAGTSISECELCLTEQRQGLCEEPYRMNFFEAPPTILVMGAREAHQHLSSRRGARPFREQYAHASIPCSHPSTRQMCELRMARAHYYFAHSFNSPWGSKASSICLVRCTLIRASNAEL